MAENKWNFCEEKPADWVPTEKVERTCMLTVFLLGLALTLGGGYFCWKIGAFDRHAFLGKEKGDMLRQNELDVMTLFHLPWTAGVLMICAAGRYFLKHRHKQPDPPKR